MIGYIIRRMAQALLVVIGVTAVTFIPENLFPGNVLRR